MAENMRSLSGRLSRKDKIQAGENKLIDAIFNSTDPANAEIIAIDFLKSAGHEHNGYKGTTGRARCIRLDGSFDYMKMSDLFHRGEW